jgi:Putative amidoligase enzyme
MIRSNSRLQKWFQEHSSNYSTNTKWFQQYRIPSNYIMAENSKSIVEKFGVEFEMVLAFHEDRLVPVLHGRGLTKKHIIKRLSDRSRSNIGIKTIPGFANPQSRPSHRGWAWRKHPKDKEDWKHQRAVIDEDYRAGETTKCRTYLPEPLEIVRNILEEHELNADIELSSHSDNFTYRDWKVSNDCSLVPLSSEQKFEYFQDRITAGQIDGWDTTGIELVTQPMRPDNQILFQEINKYLTGLCGNKDSNYGIVTSKYAGPHVHIGFSKNESFARLLQVMHHLAYRRACWR